MPRAIAAAKKKNDRVPAVRFSASLMLSGHGRVRVHALFDPGIWEQPHNQHQYIACARNSRPHEGNRQRERIHENGRQALPVFSDGLGDFRLLPVLRDKGLSQDEIGDSGTEQDDSIHRHGTGRDAVFAEPRRSKGRQRKPKKKVQIGPKDFSVDAFSGLKKVVVIVPVDADIEEAHDVTEKNRQQSAQSREARTVRNPEVQNHDGDNDRENPIAESFQAALCHLFNLTVERAIPGGPGTWPAENSPRLQIQEDHANFGDNDLLEKMASMQIRC
jgi:hypothetical protein